MGKQLRFFRLFTISLFLIQCAFPQSAFRNFASAASRTSSTDSDFMHSIVGHFFLKQGLQANGLRKMTCPFPYGPVLQGAVGPKRAISGACTAAARCIGPVSGVNTRSEREKSPANSCRWVCPARFSTRGGGWIRCHSSRTGFSSSGPPVKTTEAPFWARAWATLAKFSKGHCLVGHLAIG